MKTVKELRSMLGLSRKAFSEKYEIPLRTLESWESGARKPAVYFVRLLEKDIKQELREKYDL